MTAVGTFRFNMCKM